jgi:hypothetical protein
MPLTLDDYFEDEHAQAAFATALLSPTAKNATHTVSGTIAGVVAFVCIALAATSAAAQHVASAILNIVGATKNMTVEILIIIAVSATPAAILCAAFAFWARPVGGYALGAFQQPVPAIGNVRVIADSGATQACISSTHPWLPLPYLRCGKSTSFIRHPGVKVASAKILPTVNIVDLRFHGGLSVQGYRVDASGARIPATSELTCHHVLVLDDLDPVGVPHIPPE